jgi:bifunctional ADP-heptose synthase (sugar kinase/adenylyltransferase)
MDTRNKILSAEAAVETACRAKQQGRTLTIVTGYFDVLRTAHIRDLEAVRQNTGNGTLMVVLLPREGALLSGRARAELVAALSMVDYVVSSGEGVETLLNRLPADDVITRQAADDEQSRLLMEHVLSRHSV